MEEADKVPLLHLDSDDDMFSDEPHEDKKTDFCTTIMKDFAAQFADVIAASSSNAETATTTATTGEDNSDDEDEDMEFDPTGGDDGEDDGFGDEDGDALSQAEQLQLCSILSIIPPAPYLDSCLANKRAPPQ